MQTTNNILLIRPFTFSFNAETAVSNSFQQVLHETDEVIKERKLQEFDAFVNTLKNSGISVRVFEDSKQPEKPDAIFPNNWVSFHPDGTVVLYPMCAVNRRAERRLDIIESLKKDFEITRLHDMSHYESQDKFLEGTGSIIFDHIHKLAYACLSPRTDKDLLVELCDYLGYKPIYFYAHDKNGKEIYHTNVMMCIGEAFAVICLESITDPAEKEMVLRSLTQTSHEVVDISYEQMSQFAGNMLALKTKDNKNIVALSQSAFDSLSADQKANIEKDAALVPLFIKTIETIGGGSARCMIAEIFLQPLEPANKI